MTLYDAGPSRRKLIYFSAVTIFSLVRAEAWPMRIANAYKIIKTHPISKNTGTHPARTKEKNYYSEK